MIHPILVSPSLLIALGPFHSYISQAVPSAAAQHFAGCSWHPVLVVDVAVGHGRGCCEVPIVAVRFAIPCSTRRVLRFQWRILACRDHLSIGWFGGTLESSLTAIYVLIFPLKCTRSPDTPRITNHPPLSPTIHSLYNPFTFK